MYILEFRSDSDSLSVIPYRPRRPIISLFGILSPCLHQVLFFEDENKRAELVKQLCPAAEEIGRQVRTRQLREKDLLREALTREQRAQIVETFIRHAFSEVTTTRGDHLVLLFRCGSGTSASFLVSVAGLSSLCV